MAGPASAVRSRPPSLRWRPAAGRPGLDCSRAGSAPGARPAPRDRRGHAGRRRRAKSRSRISRTPHDRRQAARVWRNHRHRPSVL